MSDLFLVRRLAEANQWSWRQISGVENRATAQTGELEQAQAALRGQRIIGLVSSRHVLRHRIELPLKGARLLAAAPYALEDVLAEDIDELHFAVAPTENAHRGVFVARSAWLAAEIDALKELAPAELVAVVPDTAVLPTVSDDIPVFACAPDGWWLALPDAEQLCTPPGGLPGLVDRLITTPGVRAFCIDGAAPPEGISMVQRTDLADLLDADVSIARLRQFNLLVGEFTQQSGHYENLRPFLLPAAMLAGVFVLHTALSGFLLHQVKAQTDEAWQTAETAFSQTFPQITRIVDMRVQASQQLAAARSGGASSAVLELMTQSADALKQTPELQLDNVQFRDAALYLSLSGKNLQALESLRAKLEKQARLKLEVQSAQAGSDGVQIRLKLEKA